MKRLIIAGLVFILMLAAASCKSSSVAGVNDTPTPAASQSASPSPTGSEASVGPTTQEPADSSAEPTGDRNTIKLEGTIGKLPVHMTLKIEDSIVSGTYYYDKVGQDIKLEGMAEMDRMLVVNEYDAGGNITGKFDGWYTHSIDITGTWTNAAANETLNFDLKVIGGIPADAVWAGEWHRMDTGRFNSSTLVIYNETQTGFKFQMDAFSGANMGFIDGTATIEGTKAYYIDTSTGGDYPTGAEMTFSLEDGLISLTANQAADEYGGAGVGFGGKYTKGELPEATLLNQGYVTSKAQDEAFRAMTGGDYALFLDTANISVDETDLDNLGAVVTRWFVRGTAGYNASIAMFLPDGKLCAGVVDPYNNTIKVYTNADYINAIPKTIQVWADNLGDMPMEFLSSTKN